MRNKQIDVLKGIGAILVVIGHLVPYEGHLKIIIYAFHMPLFFFLSGLVFSTKKNFKEYFIKNLKTLILPYFIFNIISLLFNIDMITKDNFSVLQIFDNIFYYNCSIAWNSSLWFFIVLFFTKILFYIFAKICNNSEKKLAIITVLILGIGITININNIFIPFGMAIVPFAFTFFYMGYLYKKINILEKIKLDKKILPFTILFCIIFIISSLYNKRVNMSTNIYGNYFLYFLNALIGIYICIIFSKIVQNSKILNIYASLSMLMFSTQRILYKLYPFDTNNNIIFSIFLTLAIYFVYYLMKKFIQKKTTLFTPK